MKNTLLNENYKFCLPKLLNQLKDKIVLILERYKLISDSVSIIKNRNIIACFNMQVDHTNYDLPAQIGPIKIKPITWEDFKATPPHNSPFLAHIYWSVNYEFGSVSQRQPNVRVSVNIRPKSWKLVEQLQLLRHEYGHYLIGCLCGLSFARKVNYDRIWNPKVNFGTWCKQILNQCLSEYCQIEKLYDEQTQHYMNKEMQQSWQNKIRDQFIQFERFFKSQQPKELRRIEQRLNQVNKNILNIAGQNKIKVSSAAKTKPAIKQQIHGDSVKLKRKQLLIPINNKNVKSNKQIKIETGQNVSKNKMICQTQYFEKKRQSFSGDANRMPSISNKNSTIKPIINKLKQL